MPMQLYTKEGATTIKPTAKSTTASNREIVMILGMVMMVTIIKIVDFCYNDIKVCIIKDNY